jgi:ribosomal protein S18 acetylase RimI-like enzyme
MEKSLCSNEFVIKCLTDKAELPMNLLLLADPSEEQVMSYVNEGECYVAVAHDEIVGVYVLLLNYEQSTAEIMNVAVAEYMQGQGLGKKLVLHALEVAKSLSMSKVEIGTGNSSIGQLALYQKCGFRITGIIEDFFVDNYPEQIIENGIHCRDMIRLTFTV